MPCYHRFYGLHNPNDLFPNWEFHTLFIGTFNPLWTFAKGQNADYFYGRTGRNYFWDVLPEVYGFEKSRKNGKESWIKFLSQNKIGITDLLLNIRDAEENNLIHYQYLRTKSDINIARFNNLEWNTDNIIKLILQNKIKTVLITNLTSPEKFENEILRIKNASNEKHITFKRLVTPSFMCRFYFKKRNGLSLYECLLNEWKNEINTE